MNLEADGKTADLKDMIVTMWPAQAVCPHCARQLLASTFRLYCHPCGLWWWRGLAEAL